uniref:Ig-like domain-containing protein n=1 Tax=Pygocentrus nattereri TaxID=42514 RepID=A0A3B4EE21_PYGNA
MNIFCLFFLLGGTSNDAPCLNGLKYIHRGKNINLNCFFSPVNPAATAWFKQTPGEKPLLIASAFGKLQVKYYNDFDKSGRFNAFREKSSFNLSISNAEPSDSATYYCVFTYYAEATVLDCTVLVLKGSSSSLSSVLQPPVSDPVELGGDTTLQCSILTDASAGDHKSHPGIIYTHGNRSDECKKSSETDSPTQSCVYKLPKRNLSLSDAGTYYCAVLMCGEIIFGSGTKLDFEGKRRCSIFYISIINLNEIMVFLFIIENRALDPTIVVLVVSNIISLSVALFMCRKHSSHHKGRFNL